ncbi:MAG: DUF2207 domain-containing protein [Candidatus Kerfeldbacteria bacterium]|nr:DUF2207 domain-containing protein [Candidatus Kerfeldbacteria bacterium]
MKRWFIAAVCLTIGLTARTVAAEGLSYPDFQSDIVIGTDASITVTERITVEFTSPHHGIFRTIPFRFTTLDGSEASIPITINSVRLDGADVPVTYTTSDTDLTAKIGDADTTITGRHVYTVSYVAQAATNFFDDHDELYWNATGTSWDAPLTNVTATVTLPVGIVDAATVETACYTGPFGSTLQNCEQTQSATTASFTAHDYLTIVVGWPVGLVTKPENFEALRSQGTVVAATGVDPIVILVFAIVGAVGLATVLILFLRWQRSNRLRKPIIPQYEPPQDVRPAEASLLVDSGGESKVISATIVDLAVRGYLRIEETTSDTWLGLGHAHSYDFVERRKPDAALRPYEHQLLEALFRQPKYPAVDGRISLRTFKVHQTKTYEAFESVTETVEKIGLERGWFAHGQGLMAMFTSMTPTGAELLWHLQGFRLFLKTAERYRLQWQEKKGIFETYLPYAMVLGVAHHWSEVLGPLVTTPPDWYRGDFSNGFSTAVLWTSLSGMSTQMSTSAVSGAASGSSGFSGGSSGGGGGGGGGGGW